LAGSVVEHFDLLFQHDVQIEAESLLRIRHNLITIPGGKPEEIRHVSSHPVALAQCRRFLSRHPAMIPTPAYDTAGSVKNLMLNRDPKAGAIASRQAAEFYGAEILVEDVEDNPANFTRFFLIRNGRQHQPQSNPDKVSIAFIVENQPGSLVSALQVFAEYHTNLNKIESRPVQGQPWEYVFYVDYQISRPETVSVILDRLRQQCVLVKELGRYRSAQSQADQG
jgi:prephenate dehydratase